MTNKLTIGFGVFFAVGLIALSMLFLVSGERDAHASIYNGTILSVATTTTSVAITSSTRLLSTTTSPTGQSYTRVYASICNPNANPVVLNLDGDKTANLNAGRVTTIIAAAAGYNVCYEITDRNLYQGSITASSTNETSTTIVAKDYVQ